MDIIVLSGIVLASALLFWLNLVWLRSRQCKRRPLMFDADDDVKEALRRGELTELQDAFDVQAAKAELYGLVSHRCNGRLSVDDDSRDTECTGCARIRVLEYQLREAEAKDQ